MGMLPLTAWPLCTWLSSPYMNDIFTVTRRKHSRKEIPKAPGFKPCFSHLAWCRETTHHPSVLRNPGARKIGLEQAACCLTELCAISVAHQPHHTHTVCSVLHICSRNMYIKICERAKGQTAVVMLIYSFYHRLLPEQEQNTSMLSSLPLSRAWAPDPSFVSPKVLPALQCWSMLILHCCILKWGRKKRGPAHLPESGKEKEIHQEICLLVRENKRTFWKF